MRKLILLYCLLLFIGCSKEDKQPSTPPEPKVTLSLDIAEALPGDAVVVKINQRSTSPEVNIMLGSRTVKGYATGDSAYVFIVPVISPGATTLSITALSNSNVLNLTIKNYSPISNPQTVIDEYVSKRDKSIDSVMKVVPGSNFQPSPQSAVILSQIKEEWDLMYSSLSASDKELLGYVLQRNMLDPTQYSFEQLPAGYFARTSDTGDRLVAIAKTYVTVQSICLGTIPLLVTSGYAFVSFPNPISGLIFLGLFTTFIVTREVAIRRAEEVGRLKGVAEEITETFAQRTGFTNNQERTLNMEIKFRNLLSSDAGIAQDITSAFSTEQIFTNKDREVENIYSKATPKTTKLKGSYPSYANKIGNLPQGNMVLPIEGEQIIVKGVSDSRISYTTSFSGTTKMIKISSTVNVDIDFDIQVAYRRSLDGKEFTKDIPCTLIGTEPESVSIVSGNNQAGVANSTLSNALVVVVKDINGNAMSGVTVLWTVSAGGGQLTTATGATGSNGQASNNWKLGASGTQSVLATVKKSNGTNVTGSPVAFTASLATDTLSLLRSKTWALSNGPIKVYTTNSNCPGVNFLSYELTSATLTFNLVNGVTQGSESRTGICEIHCGGAFDITNCVWLGTPANVSGSTTFASISLINGGIRPSSPSPVQPGALPWVLLDGASTTRIVSISATELILVNNSYWAGEQMIFR